jgi:excisionase family DNA binding protein
MNPSETNQRLLNVADAAAWLGIARGTLYQWLSANKKGLPAIRLSRRCVKFRVSDLERWLDECTKPAR